MIKDLRKKFIIFAMAAVTALLLMLGASINLLTFILFEREANEMMDTLVNSEGEFMLPQPRRPSDENTDIMRSARFFMVRLNSNVEISGTDVAEIFYVTKEDAIEYAGKVIEKGAKTGRVDRYKYTVKQVDNGKIIFFLDMTRENLTIRTLIVVSLIIAAISWVVVFVFVVLTSENVVRPIEAGMEKQKRFITDAGHELKTPLAIIQTNNDANMLINGENKYNRNIKAQVIRLTELTANLLTLAKLDEPIPLALSTVDLSKLASEIIPTYADTASVQGLEMKYAIENGIIIQSDKESMTKLMTILMDNAIKYTTESGKIWFELKKDGNNTLIIEKNTCIVPENKNTEQLFERFYRGDIARTQENIMSGYGVGLSIARMICEKLGGTLKAEYIGPDQICFTAKLKG